MARAYQESHILDNLSSSLKTLQAQTAELVKTKGLQEEKITNLQKQNAEQAKKIGALETRISAKYLFLLSFVFALILSKTSSKLTCLLPKANTTRPPAS